MYCHTVILLVHHVTTANPVYTSKSGQPQDTAPLILGLICPIMGGLLDMPFPDGALNGGLLSMHELVAGDCWSMLGGTHVG